MLQRMVDLELFGLVEWLPKQCCRYHFFRRVVIQGAGEQTDTITEIMTSDEASVGAAVSVAESSVTAEPPRHTA